LNSGDVAAAIEKRVRYDFFTNIVLLIIALLPLAMVGAMLFLAVAMSGAACSSGQCDHMLFFVIRWLMIMIPFVAAIAPALIFFFNFSAEAHVLLVKEQRMPARRPH
jgi:hypothetical protein